MKHEINYRKVQPVESVTLTLTPQELATVTAAVSMTNFSKYERSIYVKSRHAQDRDGIIALHESLLASYNEAVRQGAYDSDGDSKETP